MTHHFPTAEHERLAREGMYRPEYEGDGCCDARSASLAVQAIKDGRDAVEHMHWCMVANAKLERAAA